jgi:hypothetical protein
MTIRGIASGPFSGHCTIVSAMVSIHRFSMEATIPNNDSEKQPMLRCMNMPIIGIATNLTSKLLGVDPLGASSDYSAMHIMDGGMDKKNYNKYWHCILDGG